MECIGVSCRPRALTTGLLCLLLMLASMATSAAHAPDMQVQDDIELLSHYYLRPVPDSVPAILERITASKELSSRIEAGDDISGTAYLFARIARSEPGLGDRYRDLLQRSGHTGRVFLIRVLGLMGGEDVTGSLRERLEDPEFARERGEIMRSLATLPAGADVFRMPIEKPSDLDMLWSEFMVTGDGKAIELIIEVLDRPDVTRQRFEEYLKAKPVDQSDGLVTAIKNNLWVLSDTKAGAVVTAKDLDISLVVFSLRPEHPREAAAFIREALRISNEDFSRAAMKASAAWSLMSNALQHPRILAICRDNARNRSTPVKLALLCVPACFYEDHLQIDKAEAAFREMAEADPTNLDVHLHLMRLAVEKRDLEGARRERGVFREHGLDPGRMPDRELAFLEKLVLSQDGLKEMPAPTDVPAIVRETVRRTSLVKSYSSEVFIIPIPMPSWARSASPVKFEMEYEKPDRFSVFRRMISDPEAMPACESWVTLGRDTYSRAGKWYKIPSLTANHDKTNDMLRMDKWATLLEANAMREVRAFESWDKRYYCITFPVVHADSTLADLVSAGRNGNAEVWIDADTYDIVACEIRSMGHDARGNGLGLLIQQVFGDFDGAGPVGPPEGYIDLSQGKATSLM